MPYGQGRGFGFRGYSPPWPYVGLGRGGLPRCWAYMPYSPSGENQYGEAYPYYNPPPPHPEGFGGQWMPPYAPPTSPEQELNFLKNQAQMLGQQLDQINARVEELEKGGQKNDRVEELEKDDQKT